MEWSGVGGERGEERRVAGARAVCNPGKQDGSGQPPAAATEESSLSHGCGSDRPEERACGGCRVGRTGEVSAFHRLLQVQGGWASWRSPPPPARLLLQMDQVCLALPNPRTLPIRGERSRQLVLRRVCVGGPQHSGPKAAGGRPPGRALAAGADQRRPEVHMHTCAAEPSGPLHPPC